MGADKLGEATDGKERPNPSWLVLKGEMAAAIASFPWGKTPLGRIEDWPPNLRFAVRLMLDGGAPMALIWGKDFRFLYNDPYKDIIQDKHPAALGAPGVEIFPEIWHEVLPLFQRTLSGEAVLVDDYELTLTRRGKAQASYFSFSYNPIRNELGQVDGFLAVVIETTARIMHEREHAQVFDTVLSAITDFAYTFDRDGRFVYVNKALLDLLGLRLKDAVGKNFFDLKYPEELAARLQGQIQQVIKEGKALRDETSYESPSGAKGYYEYILSPVIGPEGSVVVVAGSTRDITARKRLELEAVAASRAKDEFLATLSHELRTPLNPVLLLATDAADNRDLPEEVRADFKSIADNVTLEARLIDDLLDITRITHDKLAFELKPLPIHPLLVGVIESIQPELAQKKLVLSTVLEASPGVVSADQLRLRQVFGNLLRNAIKFTNEGGRIEVSTALCPGKPETMRVEITDTGIGLTPEEIGKIFTPFAQGDHGIKGQSPYGGLGLGLAISRKIAEMHSGTLSAHSPGRNQGATFTVELPLISQEAQTKVAKNTDREATNPATRRQNYRVLLVEDHDSSRHALARLLANRKMDVTQASSASEALAQAKDSVFDLVISDIGLPDADGYALMKALTADHDIPGIALSGYGTERDITRSKEAGFMTHLTKPVQANALDAALNLFVDSRK